MRLFYDQVSYIFIVSYSHQKEGLLLVRITTIILLLAIPPIRVLPTTLVLLAGPRPIDLLTVGMVAAYPAEDHPRTVVVPAKICTPEG